MFGVPGSELAAPTPAAWVEIFGRRLTLWKEQQLLLPQPPILFAAPPSVLADRAHLIAETSVQGYSFSASSMASPSPPSSGSACVFWQGVDSVASCPLLHLP